MVVTLLRSNFEITKQDLLFLPRTLVVVALYNTTLIGCHPTTQGMHMYMHTPTAQPIPHGGQQEWLGRHYVYNHILGLSATDRRVIETHAKPRDSTRQRRLPALCLSSRRTGNNV